MKKIMILMLSLMIFSGSAMAQEKLPDGQKSRAMRPQMVKMTQEQMTEKMVSDLKLDEKQAKKVTKLNKKFKTLIEGEQQDNMRGQRPPMGQGRPDGNRGSTTTIKGGTISSSASGANGVFSYGGNGGRNGAEGDGTTVIIEDTKITTTGDGSGGIMTTGGGIMKAKNLTVNTSGRSSAPIRSDRGGGVVTVEGGSYTSSGQGSPVIYSTADITVSDAVLTSTMSEGAVIEGKNSITLNNCQMTVSNTRRNSHAQFLDGIMLFQSFSGDAAKGNSHFIMNGGTFTNRQGHLIHVTNTNAIITLNGVKLVNDDPAKVLLSVCADGWQGAGNKATLNATGQQLEGTILVGSDSELTLTLTKGSTFTGCIGGNITNAAGNTISTETGKVSVTLGEGCTWNLTADTYITSFIGDASRIKSNGHCLYM